MRTDILPDLRRAAEAYKAAKTKLDDYSLTSSLGLGISDREGVAMVYAVTQLLSGHVPKAGSAEPVIHGLDQGEIARLVSERVIEYLSDNQDVAKPDESPSHTSVDEAKIAKLVAQELRSYFASNSVPCPTPEYRHPVNGRVPYVTVSADLDISDFEIDDEDLEEESEGKNSDKELEIGDAEVEENGDDDDLDEEEFDEEYHDRTRVLNKRIGILLKTLTSSGWQLDPNNSAPADVRDVYNGDAAMFILTKQESNENLRLQFSESDDSLRVFYTLQVPRFIQGANDIRIDFVEDAKFNLSEIMDDFVKAFGSEEDQYDGEAEFSEAADWFTLYTEDD